MLVFTYSARKIFDLTVAALLVVLPLAACEDADDPLLAEAEDAIAAATAAAAAAASATTTPPPPDPRCDQEREKLHDSLYRNKHDFDGEGSHGFFRRAMEQMCGSSGPGAGAASTVWNNHMGPFRGMRNSALRAQNRLRDLERQGICAPGETFSERDNKILDNIRNNRAQGSTSRLWQPANLPHYGRSHSFCSDWVNIARGDVDTLIQRVLQMT